MTTRAPVSFRSECRTTTRDINTRRPLVSRQYFLMEELLSPIVTPLILCFYLRQKSLDIVDFFRNFTVEVIGVSGAPSCSVC